MARQDTAARRYAEAAFEIAQRDGTVDAWRSDLLNAAAILGDDRVARQLANPALALEDRAKLVNDLVGTTVSRPALNLVQLMLRRGRIDQVTRVAGQFRQLDNRRQGITEATATAAAELTPAEVRALTSRLEDFTGGRVELAVTVDPALLGGVLVRVGDQLIDGSVRGRLERLRNRLVSGAL
jgi:F-type H+-transporting ATPase subunit delta